MSWSCKEMSVAAAQASPPNNKFPTKCGTNFQQTSWKYSTESLNHSVWLNWTGRFLLEESNHLFLSVCVEMDHKSSEGGVSVSRGWWERCWCWLLFNLFAEEWDWAQHLDDGPVRDVLFFLNQRVSNLKSNPVLNFVFQVLNSWHWLGSWPCATQSRGSSQTLDQCKVIKLKSVDSLSPAHVTSAQLSSSVYLHVQRFIIMNHTCCCWIYIRPPTPPTWGRSSLRTHVLSELVFISSLPHRDFFLFAVETTQTTNFLFSSLQWFDFFFLCSPAGLTLLWLLVFFSFTHISLFSTRLQQISVSAAGVRGSVTYEPKL